MLVELLVEKLKTQPAEQLVDAAPDIERSPLTAEVVERNDSPGAWGVEAININGDGEIYMAVFYGPEAKALAIEYAEAKYSGARVN